MFSILCFEVEDVIKSISKFLFLANSFRIYFVALAAPPPKGGYSYLGYPERFDFNGTSKSGEYYNYIRLILGNFFPKEKDIKLKDCSDHGKPNQKCFNSAHPYSVILTSSHIGEVVKTCHDSLIINMNYLLQINKDGFDK